MKVLHTSDWHLGQRLLQQERHEEFVLALDWLLEQIVQQRVEVLLVSGDVFDIGNPPNQARQLYYNFLRRLLQTECRHIVITGGNHDSPAMLNAPRELLEALNIHVIGAATDDIADELLLLHHPDSGQAELAVAAVPFLRDRDLRTSLIAEDMAERQKRLQAGLTAHYEQLAALAEPHKGKLPILAMGHLYAKGAVSAERQDNIYIGNRENMEAQHFPALFDYVALGHIHRAQLVEGQPHIRYSGSLIPLSFSETSDDKVVLLLDVQTGKPPIIEPLPVPTFRRLKTIRGTLEEIQAALARFAARDGRILTSWVEVIIESEDFLPHVDQLLRDFTKEMPLEILKIKIIRTGESYAEKDTLVPELEMMDVQEVFERCCTNNGITQPEELARYRGTFTALMTWIQEREA